MRVRLSWALLRSLGFIWFVSLSAHVVAGPPPIEEPPEFLPENQFFSLAAPDQQGRFNQFTGQYSLHPVDLKGVSSLHQVQRIRDASNPSGALGNGWVLNWEIVLDRTGGHPVFKEGSLATEFVPDADEAGVFWSHHGDQLRLQSGTATLLRSDNTVDVFDSSGRLTKRSRHGVDVSLSYNSTGRLTSITGPQDKAFKLSWRDSRLIRIEDVDGRGVSYVYEDNQLVRVEVDDKPATSFTYDAKGRLRRILNPQFQFIELRYDEQDRVVTLFRSDLSEETVKFSEEE